jgi:hypothetical protein
LAGIHTSREESAGFEERGGEGREKRERITA